MMFYTLAYPGMLLFLIVLLLFLIRHCLKKNPTVSVGSLTPFLEAEKKGFSFRRLLRKGLPVLFYALGGVSLVFAMSSPREGMEQIRRRADGIDIIIALDLSGSMQAIDVPGNIRTERELSAALASGKVMNRLASAKKEVTKFIEARPNDRIGLVAFAPLPYLVCPFAHTIGLQEAEAPFFGPNSDDVLVPGMTVCVDVSFFGHPEFNGARIETGYLITENGPVPFSPELDALHTSELK